MKFKNYLIMMYVFILLIIASILVVNCQQTVDTKENNDEKSSSSSSVSSSSSSSSQSSSSAEFDYYVDAVNGNDSYSGTTTSSAFKTITYAVNNAGTNKKIKVLPGLYDGSNGEVFPITLQEGQELKGDPDNKGDGSVATEIIGTGAVPATTNYAACICAENSVIEGFKFRSTFNQTSFYCVYIGDVSATLLSNTFTESSFTYGGVLLDYTSAAKNININNNFFMTYSYGIYIIFTEANINISENVFAGSMFAPIDVANTTSSTLIYNNLFMGTNSFAIMVENGYPVIQDNDFDNLGGYSNGAIYCQYAAYPKIRDNYFNCLTAVKVYTGGSSANPDIGTAGDLGGNNFTDVSGFVIIKGDNNATGDLYAVGNTWPVYPPVLGTHVFIEATGDRVWYGTGASDYLQK